MDMKEAVADTAADMAMPLDEVGNPKFIKRDVTVSYLVPMFSEDDLNDTDGEHLLTEMKTVSSDSDLAKTVQVKSTVVNFNDISEDDLTNLAASVVRRLLARAMVNGLLGDDPSDNLYGI
jgi:hypothetical protein